MRTMKRKGFTLIELLVVMAILGILSSIGFGQYQTSQKKARDAQRKADLGNLSRALEMYYNDHRSYPLSENGKIKIGSEVLEWGEDALAVKDPKGNTVVYMKKLPDDPASNFDYCYQSDGTSFRLYARLENENDPDRGNYTCNGGKYQYGVSSSNVTP